MPDTAETATRPRRSRSRAAKLCLHGYPAIPDPRGCAACWTKHPSYVKPKPASRAAPDLSHHVTCELCFLPSQPGAPPLRRVRKAEEISAKYAHDVCPSDTMTAPTPPRRKRRQFRRALASSLRRYMRRQFRILKARRKRASLLCIAMAQQKRSLAAKAQQVKEKQRARPARVAG